MDSIRTVLDSLFTIPNLFWFLFGIILLPALNYLRRPRVEVLPHEDNPFVIKFSDTLIYASAPEEVNFLLRLKIRNYLLKIFGREIPILKPAVKCHCWIEFYDDKGTPACQEPMLARWGRLSSADTKWDLKFALYEGDVDPSEKTAVDVVIRFDGHKECYGVWRHTRCIGRRGFREEPPKAFNEEWRRTDENWRLAEGTYKIRVLIKSDGKILKKEYFHLTNGDSIQQFRLDRIAPFKVQGP